MIKEKENILYFHKRHFCLSSFQWTGKYIFSQYNSFSTTQCYLYKAMILFIRLVDLPILSCLCQAFAMSSDIKNDLLNLQKYLIVGETSSSSTKVAKEMRNKYQKKKIGRLSSCDWEILNTLTEDELSSALIYQLGIIQKD